jgi:hypothetical protein
MERLCAELGTAVVESPDGTLSIVGAPHVARPTSGIA